MSATLGKFNERGGATVHATGDHAATLEGLPDYLTSAGKAEATALLIGPDLYMCSFQALQLIGFDWTSPRNWVDAETQQPGQVFSV